MSWGSVIQAVGGLAEAGISAWSANKVNNDNLRFQREVAQNGVRWKVNDMREAGLNPLLATGINATAPAGGSSVLPNLSGISTSARDIGRMLAEKTVEKADAEIDAVKAQKDNLEAQADKAGAEAKKIEHDTRSSEVDADYREMEKWTNAVGKGAGAVAAAGGGAYALSKFAPYLTTSSRQISGFAESARRNPVPSRVLDAIRAGGARGSGVLKSAMRIGGPALAMYLLTEAARKGAQYAFERERSRALEDKRREHQGKAYKSTFNFDRHF